MNKEPAMVDSSTLQHEHEAMQAAAKEFGQVLEDLNSYVAPVRTAHEQLEWQSDAAAKYRELFEEWLAQYGNITQALDTMLTVLGANAKEYADNEAEALASVRAMGGTSPTGYTPSQKALLGM